MNMKKNWIALGAALMLGLTGCGGQTSVNAEQAGILASAAAITDKFAGVVISENAVEINRDTDKQIEQLYVSVGDTVRVNEKLFEYDSDTLSLTVDKQELEMDKLEQQIKELNSQIKTQESEIKTAKKNKEDTTLMEMNLRQLNADLTQATYDKNALQAEINYNNNMLKNAVVRSPIKGTIRSINENGTPYITIQQAGAFQIKGILNELSLNAGIMEGTSVTILSRTDPTAFWTGEVSMVDYGNGSSNEYDSIYGSTDGMSTSTSYPFYITLDSTDGLLLGQHVYIQISAAAVQDDLLRIPESYIMDIHVDETGTQLLGSVWGVDMEKQTLTKITVTLGEYDSVYDTYVILDGITATDYIANPADSGVQEGASVTLRSEPEYMGQTEPAPTISGTDTGIPDDAANGDPIEDPVSDSPDPDSDKASAPESTYNDSGSLVISTEDPEKTDD